MENVNKCAYCGAPLAKEHEICPSCGAPNPGFVPGGSGTRRPRTIEELQAFCDSKGMPLEKMRFFIGVDEPSPKAFGIYREGDRFIVYKYKADGSRAVRYDGPDEAYAVKELFEKLLEEHRLRRNAPSQTRSSGGQTSQELRNQRGHMIAAFVVLLIIATLVVHFYTARMGHRKDGYYRTKDHLYYRYGSSWYVDSGLDDWIPADGFPEDDYGDYYMGDSYDGSWGGSDFTDSDVWEDLQDSDSDSDWDFDDTDYGDWDSGDTDWDSDW